MTDNLKQNESSLMCTFECLVGEEVVKGIALEIRNLQNNDDESEKKRKGSFCTVNLVKLIENALIKYFSHYDGHDQAMEVAYDSLDEIFQNRLSKPEEDN